MLRTTLPPGDVPANTWSPISSQVAYRTKSKPPTAPAYKPSANPWEQAKLSKGKAGGEGGEGTKPSKPLPPRGHVWDDATQLKQVRKTEIQKVYTSSTGARGTRAQSVY